jgi:hypothetical protein
MRKKKSIKGMRKRSFMVSEKLKIRDKGHMGMYFTQIDRKEFKKVWHIK